MPRPTQGRPTAAWARANACLGVSADSSSGALVASVAYLSDSRRLAAEKRASAVLVLSHEAPPSHPATVGGK